MNLGPGRDSSHLFTVRLWVEMLGGGEIEIRGKVQHVLSGETRHFREWPALVLYLTTKMQQLDLDGDEEGDR